MFQTISNPYLIPFDGSFRYSQATTKPPKDQQDKKINKKKLKKLINEMDELQRIFYAENSYALLLIFQAMDAAGKDSTIRTVMTGINPAGCQVYSFKQPTPEELDHDFLWRTTRCLPERGRIGIFNRSYYEEVLVVRVHPEFLQSQKLPHPINHRQIWKDRYQSICAHEEYLARNGTIILKFWLNVSKKEQKKRFLSRLEEPHKNYKFSVSDVTERTFWRKYMDAYEKALKITSKPWAPWYAIPADDKPFMRLCVAEIIVQTMKTLDLTYPTISDQERSRFKEIRQKLINES